MHIYRQQINTYTHQNAYARTPAQTNTRTYAAYHLLHIHLPILHLTDDLYEWDDPYDDINGDNADDDGYLFGSNRERRDAAGIPNVRSRRDGNYIRFGRSITDLSADPSVRRTLLASFGAPARRTSSGHYMRFGRSVDHVTEKEDATGGETDEKRFMRFGKRELDESRDSDNEGGFARLTRPFMRFGRGGSELKRAFMRFGRSGSEEGQDDGQSEKRAFMRFGRSHWDGEDDEATKRAFMRFGRDFTAAAEDELIGREHPVEQPDKKAFMRFGKRPFMRFGRGTSDGDQKRFMRFGRKDDDDEQGQDSDADVEKRFMRFGKRAFMRFGRGSAELDDADQSAKRAFMRFGRRVGDGERDKKFMRFGRAGPTDDTGKRFMRFGRRDETSKVDGGEKRFMRFGKRQPNEREPETASTLS